MKVAEGQLHNRRQQFELVPLPNMDAVLAQEFYKGEMSGIQLFQVMIPARIGELTEMIEEKLREEQKDADTRNGEKTSGNAAP